MSNIRYNGFKPQITKTADVKTMGQGAVINTGAAGGAGSVGSAGLGEPKTINTKVYTPNAPGQNDGVMMTTDPNKKNQGTSTSTPASSNDVTPTPTPTKELKPGSYYIGKDGKLHRKSPTPSGDPSNSANASGSDPTGSTDPIDAPMGAQDTQNAKQEVQNQINQLKNDPSYQKYLTAREELNKAKDKMTAAYSQAGLAYFDFEGKKHSSDNYPDYLKTAISNYNQALDNFNNAYSAASDIINQINELQSLLNSL